MITPKQWQAFSRERKKELLSDHTFFPRNNYGIPSGYYRADDVVSLLRKHKNHPARVQFIADMLE